jgi:transcriptional regulator with XRE-family HTH domain
MATQNEGARLLAAMVTPTRTQAVLAAEVGVTQQTVSDWIACGSTPRGGNLMRLRTVLNIPIEAWFQPVAKPARKPSKRASGPHRVTPTTADQAKTGT